MSYVRAEGFRVNKRLKDNIGGFHMKKTAVVAGATGVIGKYIIDYFKE